MRTRTAVKVLLGIVVISAWVLGSGAQAGAETMNYKFYMWMIKADRVPIDDVEGHILALAQRGGFYVFENGEIATTKRVSMNDLVNESGSSMSYETIKFVDGSTIVLKGQGSAKGTATGALGSTETTSEIIKGTGRFEGIKGTQSAKAKALPADKGEAGSKLYGEGTLAYTLPPK
ncbi:MAG TPA: hypothetical protein VKF36_18695 [Syntrophorhabdales bacterium]|nr:hypothetical protein [Syntrophorhabdales bacterium]